MQHTRTSHSNTSEYTTVKKPRLNTRPLKNKNRVDALNVFSSVFFEPNEETAYDISTFFADEKKNLLEHLEEAVQEKKAIKWRLILKIVLEKTNAGEETETLSTYFSSKTCEEFTNLHLEDHLEEAHQKLLSQFENFIQRGSGWVLKHIVHFELKVAKYAPLKGSSYLPLPNNLKGREAILNIQNFEDEKCFLWCVLAHRMKINFKGHPERVTKYKPYEHTINMSGITYPVPFSQVSKVEALNNLRINVFGYEEGEICILHVSEKTNEDVINLLLISDGENTHYTLIRDFSRFMSFRSKHDGAAFYCFRCLHGFTREALLHQHTPYCSNHTPQVIKMPKEGENILNFTGIHYQAPVPFVIYADFESLLIPIATADPSNSSSFQSHVAEHVACGYAYVIVGPDNATYKPIQVYRGENAAQHFIDALMKEKRELEEKLLTVAPMRLTDEQEQSFKDATECCICGKTLGKDRVRDHCHISSAYRGAAHSYCNLHFKQSKVIPVVFHNLKKYDAHHIFKKLGCYPNLQIDVIAATLEDYITFKLKENQTSIQFSFLDSLQFLPASLEKLTSNLHPSDFNILKQNFPQNTNLDLLTRKGVYPYSYFTSFSKFQEKHLPPKEAFRNDLTKEDITPEEYQHAENIWAYFNMKSLGDYHDLYVRTDVLLLADIFENFRGLCKKYYDIDAAHLVTSPGLSWQACLKMTGVQLELLTDVNMLLFIEKGIRGGVSQITHRFAVANNAQVPNYNTEEDTSHIMYWDANNLYGWAMSQFLPCGGFRWSQNDFTDEDILKIDDNSPIGYVFEVDLEYPHSLHELHNDYPLAPERITVSEEMLSPYARSLTHSGYKGSPKLIPNLFPKHKYVCHYRNLKLYLQLGMKLKKVHQVLEFRQTPWLKDYISFNTEKRKMATSTFQKDFFKLLNNSIYGKCIENLRKRRNIEICNESRRAEKIVASPFFKSFKIFDEGLVAVERQKPSILMNRPIYVGFTILELSKVLMYDFHYNFVKKNYSGSRSSLLFTDTDSLTYLLKTENLRIDMEQHSSKFDFSDYPQDHPLYSTANKKVLGKFKDELNGRAVHEFVGLKAKMYSIKTGEEEKKRAKGICTKIVRNKLKHDDYKNCLLHQETSFELQTRIGQRSHQLFTINQNKKCLSPFDDKRYILDDGISSLAYGHFKIPKG